MTDFWNSLGNSLLITVVTVVLAMLIHSLLGYAIARNKAHSKFYKFIYFYVVSGMFVPFAILMMPVVKQTAQMGLANRAGVIILYLVFYMPMNVLLYSGYLTNIPMALEEAACVDGASTWTTYWKIIFPIMKPMHATVAVLTALGTWNDVMTPLVIMSGTGKNTLPLAQLNFQTQIWNELQSGICFVPAGTSANLDLLSDLSETYSEWRGEWSRKIIGTQIEFET